VTLRSSCRQAEGPSGSIRICAAAPWDERRRRTTQTFLLVLLEELFLLRSDRPPLPLPVRFFFFLLLRGMRLSARDASTAATAQDGIMMMMMR
jgi:hypothetical protein